jgi:hypothetical protein
MPSVLHIVAACTDLKRAEPLPALRLRAHRGGPARAERWLRALHGAKPVLAANDLYVGNHWSTCRGLPTEARSVGWGSVQLWVASAGYGLIPAERAVAAYSATFANGHADSVSHTTSAVEASLARRSWWKALCRSGRSLASLTADGAALLFVGSPAYVDATHDDLGTAVAVARRPKRIIVVTSAEIGDELGLQIVLAAGAMRTALGGPMTSLNARLAHRLAGTLRPRYWSVESARSIATAVAAEAPPTATRARTAMHDDAVRAYVRKQLKRDELSSKSALHRRLRDSGRACEQKRFGRLYTEVVASWSQPAE